MSKLLWLDLETTGVDDIQIHLAEARKYARLIEANA